MTNIAPVGNTPSLLTRRAATKMLGGAFAAALVGKLSSGKVAAAQEDSFESRPIDIEGLQAVIAQEVTPESEVSVKAIKKAILKVNPEAEKYGFDSAEIQAALAETTDPVMQEALGKMDWFVNPNQPSEFSQKYRALTVLDLETLAAFEGDDDKISLANFDKLPEILNWNI